MSESTKELSGRELDIAIAERVMQWPRRDRDDDRDYEDTFFSAYNDGGQIVVFRGGSQRRAERWSPAQNIEAAMLVVERLIGIGFQVFMATKLTGRKWQVTIRLWKNGTSHGSDCWQEFADSLPEAICRCGLAAMESKS